MDRNNSYMDLLEKTYGIPRKISTILPAEFNSPEEWYNYLAKQNGKESLVRVGINEFEEKLSKFIPGYSFDYVHPGGCMSDLLDYVESKQSVYVSDCKFYYEETMESSAGFGETKISKECTKDGVVEMFYSEDYQCNAPVHQSIVICFDLIKWITTIVMKGYDFLPEHAQNRSGKIFEIKEFEWRQLGRIARMFPTGLPVGKYKDVQFFGNEDD